MHSFYIAADSKFAVQLSSIHKIDCCYENVRLGW